MTSPALGLCGGPTLLEMAAVMSGCGMVQLVIAARIGREAADA